MKVELPWWVSAESVDGPYVKWEEKLPVVINPGSALWVRTAINNVQEATNSITNFVVPAGVTVLRWEHRDHKYTLPITGAENEIVGLPPAHAVQFFVSERAWTPPNYVWMAAYLLAVPALWRESTLGLLHEIVTSKGGDRSFRELLVRQGGTV